MQIYGPADVGPARSSGKIFNERWMTVIGRRKSGRTIRGRMLIEDLFC